MKKFSLLAFMCILLFAFIGCTEKHSKQITFYVSLSGNDSWSGKLSEPKSDNTDGPFATLQKARNAIRHIKEGGPLPRGGVIVYIRGGIYSISETFKLSAEDSGTEDAPIIWRAYPDEDVHFNGGRVITGFEPINEPSVLTCIDKTYHDRILKIDLKARGISNFGEMKPTGFGRPIQPTALELFFKGKPMTIARYPNEGWLKIAGVPQTGEKPIQEGLDRRKVDGIPAGRHYGRFAYDGDRPKNWLFEVNDIWMHGYWTWDWAESYEKVKKIDTRLREIYTEEPHGVYGYTKYQRYYFLNVLEELDTPGEWYLDRTRGILYFWPASPINEGDANISILEELMVSLEETSYITIQGIIFEGTRASAIKIEGGTNNKIAGCTMRNIGNIGAIISGGKQNGIISCDIYETGDGGIRISGGDRKTLTPAGNYATNNHIHHYSRVNRTYRPAIIISGVGNFISHNYIHDAPHMGVAFSGNEHILEFNEIHDIALETGDVGAFYIGRDWTQRENIIRHNFFHHIQGPGLHGAMSVYLDDWASGTTIYGNVFYKAGRAAFIGGGRDNTVENNIFVECAPSVHVDARGLGWASYYFDGTTTTLTDRMDAVKYNEPPYSERYPELLTLYDDDPAIPKYNRIIHNVSYGGRWLDLYDGLDFSIVTVKNNLISDPELCKWRRKDKKDFITYTFGEKEIMDELKDNMIVDVDPGFVDLENGNFQLKSDSPAYKLGFKRIPIEKIGLYSDEYRKSLPDDK